MSLENTRREQLSSKKKIPVILSVVCLFSMTEKGNDVLMQ